LQAIIEHADLDRTRRSLYIAALFTFVIANAQFQSREMSIFGLRVIIDPEQLVALGRFSVTFLLCIFLLHSISNILALFEQFKRAAFDNWESAAKEELVEIENQMMNPDYGQDYGEPEPWDAHYYDQRVLRKTSVERVERIKLLFETSKRFILNYAIVVIFASIALLYPTLAGAVVSRFNFS
jgi:hypothetical protein